MAPASSIPAGGLERLKRAGKSRTIRDISSSRPLRRLAPAVLSQKSPNLRIVRNLLLIVLAVLLLPYLLAPFYRAGHPVSTLMAWRWLTGAQVSRQWIDFAAISPALPRSVVAAEDAKFCSHHGIDWDALRDVIEDAEDGEVARGGSTITQQVAKNLFLWPGRSLVRKALEFPLAIWIDLVLPKQRILEIYLNIAELGPDRPVRRRSRRQLCLRPLRLHAVAARSRTFGGDSAQSGAGAAPAIPAPGCAGWPGPISPGRRPPALQRCWRENRAF